MVLAILPFSCGFDTDEMIEVVEGGDEVIVVRDAQLK